ncbi:MAG TPA: hypothetical protein VJ576_04860 [Rhodocyclaceae bacterium]|nr:hypothetical protein [Rhodocyclaceae bacterium]
MNLPAVYGLLAWALLAGAGAAFFLPARRLPVAVVAAGLALVPAFAGESLAMLLHGALAAPSFTLVQAAVWRVGAPGRRGWLGSGAAAGLLAVGLVFYPLTLGLGPFDPYGLGYRPLPILLALLPLAGWLAWRRQQAWLAVLGLDLLAYGAGLFDNLWDALFDPLLVALAAALLVRRLVSRLRPGRSGGGRW